MSKEKTKRGSEGDGADDVGRFGAVVRSALVATGLNSETASKYSWFCMEIYTYILAHPKTMTAIKNMTDAHKVFENSSKAFNAAKLIERGAAVGVTSAKVGLTAYSASAGANVLQVFVERFQKLAETQGIELNECSMGVVKVSLDIATAGTGSLTALSGFGVVLAGLGVLATAKDSYALRQLCFASG